MLRYYPQATGSTLSRQSYLYNASGELIRVGYGNTDYTDYTYDSFGRLSVAELKNAYGDRLGAKDTYQYALHGNEGDRQTTSGQLRQLQKTEKVNGQEVTVFYTYTYDYAGNITEIRKTASDGTLLSLSSYLYDKIGQLTRENVKDDETGVSFTQFYTYTNSGNLTARRKYAYTTGTVSGTPLENIAYTYGDSTFKDLLTSVGGESISYDAIGNPTSYRGATLTFQGRRLLSYTKAGTAVSYAYDADGIRTRKTVGNVRHEYETEGGKVYRELIYNGNTLTFDLRYFYDAAGRPAMLQLLTATDSGSMESTVFYYGTNAQGDVIAIYDANGNRMVSYTYDAWGNTLSTQTNGIWGSTVSSLNPFGYRSYYYDSDTGLYYLQSRYYGPEIGRFINADDIDYLGADGSPLSYNLFAYCENNPVIRSDSTGQWFGLDDLIAGAVGAVIGVASQFVSDVVTSAISGSWQFSSWQTYVGAGVGGAVGGVTTLYVGPVVGAAVGAGASTLIGQTLENVTGGQKRSAAEIVMNTVVDATIGAVVSKAVPVKVSGITSGRNSMNAVFKSGLTKLGNKTASKMSIKVVGKGIASGFVANLGLAFGMGVKSFISNSWQSYQKRQTATPTGTLYWCAP